MIFCKSSTKVKSLILNVNKWCAVWEMRVLDFLMIKVLFKIKANFLRY